MKDDEQAHPFAIVPVEVMMDNRLTLETMRVLVTLFSFRNKVTGLAFPSREAISERCGMHPSNISDATTKLVELGWLVKNGAGGYSKVTKYTIRIPEKVAEQATLYKERSEARKGKKVAEQATVAQSAIVAEQAIPESSLTGSDQVAQSAIRKGTDQLTDQGTEKTVPPPKKPTSEKLLFGIDPQIASDFLALRKAKNIPLTQTALNGINREAEKLGYSLEQALRVCCERGWAGFKAEWILKDQAQNGRTQGRLPNKQEALEQSNRAATDGWMPPELRETKNAN